MGAVAWRKRVGEVAAALGASDLAGIRRKLGSRWAYRLRDAITLASAEEWQAVTQLDGAATTDPRQPAPPG